MAIDVQRTLDFGGVRRITNLPDAVSAQEPATKAQLDASPTSNAYRVLVSA